MKTERRLKELGIELAPATSPLANYVNAVRICSASGPADEPPLGRNARTDQRGRARDRRRCDSGPAPVHAEPPR